MRQQVGDGGHRGGAVGCGRRAAGEGGRRTKVKVPGSPCVRAEGRRGQAQAGAGRRCVTVGSRARLRLVAGAGPLG